MTISETNFCVFLIKTQQNKKRFKKRTIEISGTKKCIDSLQRNGGHFQTHPSQLNDLKKTLLEK